MHTVNVPAKPAIAKQVILAPHTGHTYIPAARCTKTQFSKGAEAVKNWTNWFLRDPVDERARSIFFSGVCVKHGDDTDGVAFNRVTPNANYFIAL